MSDLSFDETSRQTAPEFVASKLQEEILSGAIEPGESIRQDHIAQRYRVSQSSVREAYRKLEAQGLVKVYRNRGAFASSLTLDEIDEIYRIRSALEILALRQSAALWQQQKTAELAVLLNEIEVERWSFFGEGNRKFHEILYFHPSRQQTQRVLESLYGNVTRFWRSLARKSPERADTYEQRSRGEHRSLFETYRNCDAPLAEELLREHIDGGRRTLLDFLGSVDGTPTR
jgi:DNA-binding GntR family transcriptional regulator